LLTDKLRGFLSCSLAVVSGVMLLVSSLQPAPIAEAKALSDLVVVIDAGHGKEADSDQPGYGKWTGSCRTWDGVKYCEDPDNLAMAQGAKYYLEQYGVQVIMTRSDDWETVDWNCDAKRTNTDRWYLANNLQSTCVVNKLGFKPKKAKADLYVSFHMNVAQKNGADDPTPSGTTCWYSSLGTAANHKTQSIQLCKDNMDKTDNVYKVYNYTPLTWSTSLYFDNLDMPHAVVEAGFMTNKADTLWFNDYGNAHWYGQYAGWGTATYWYNLP
jgi:N-acetylmuramoyl-L-alanine amidase